MHETSMNELTNLRARPLVAGCFHPAPMAFAPRIAAAAAGAAGYAGKLARAAGLAGGRTKHAPSAVGNRHLARYLWLAVLFACLPSTAHANVLLPLMGVTPLLLVLILLPAIVLEAFVLWLWLDVSLLSAAGLSLTANLASTAIGIPAAIIVTGLSSGIVTEVAARLRIGRNSSGRAISQRVSIWHESDDGIPIKEAWLGWATEIVLYTTVIASFFISWRSERLIVAYKLDDQQTQAASDAVFNANLLTYGIIILYLCKYSVAGYKTYRKRWDEYYSTKKTAQDRIAFPAASEPTDVPKVK